MSKYWKDFNGLKAKKSYDAQTALSLAVVSYLSYQNKTTVTQVAKGWGFDNAAFISVKKGKDIDTQCLAIGNDTHVIVAFRGSASLQDWFTNFQAVRDPGPLYRTKAHEGFQDALFPAVLGLTNAIESFRDKDQKLWLTGHSLGGALASLYSGMLIENGYPVYGLYHFGSPRPGDANFDKKLNKAIPGPHFRIANVGDIVPHVPPEPFFSHPGRRVILKPKRRETSKSAWTKVRKAIFSRFMNMTGNPLIIKDNHVLDEPESGYLDRLKADLKRSQ